MFEIRRLDIQAVLSKLEIVLISQLLIYLLSNLPTSGRGTRDIRCGFRVGSTASNNELGFMAQVVALVVDETLGAPPEESLPSGTTHKVISAGIARVFVVPILICRAIKS